MSLVKALVITGFGINCEEELAAAYRLAGADATIVHLNDIISGSVNIHDYDIINFPGGFSFGDDIASGKVLANKIKYKKLANGSTLIDELILFIKQKKFIIGICNGFQVLTRLGLIPNISGDCTQEVTLTYNKTGHFIDDWCTLKVENPESPFFTGMDAFDVPIRHGEGRLIIRNERIRQIILEKKLNCLSFVENPNGSELDCAGLSDVTGQVLGMMPHPEAYLSLYNHPDWQSKKLAGRTDEAGDGLRFFRNIVSFIERGKH